MTAILLALALAPAPVTAAPEASPRAIEPEAAPGVEANASEVPVGTPTETTTPETETPEADAEVDAEPEQETIRAKVSRGNKQTKAPYYDPADIRVVRQRHKLDPDMNVKPRKAKWRCLIADPVCGFNAEVNATSAFAGRFKQGDVRNNEARKWSSGRAQYDVWINIPVLVETIGRHRFTKMTLGPKAGVMFSDTGDTWGNIGMAMRYWLGRGKWAPTIELTTGMAFKIARRPVNDLGGEKPKYEMQRGPIGITGDIGFGLGGFGAIVLGGQYDSPLAREDVPERFRTSASGMLFVGFRGNILWGGPAAAAVLTHGLTQRYGKEPR